MAISVGDALLKLGIDTKDLDKGMKGLGNRIKKHQKAIGLGMVAMGGAILAAGLLSIKTYAKMGDEVQKMALRTGFATEALSELRHAAEISGASLETLEKGVKKMAKTIVDASDGLMTYVRSFEKIGLTAEELMELAPEEQFDKITMAIAALESPTLRAAVAQDIFGRAGTQLLPLLAQGAEGIKELREEAHKLGIVFDQEAANAAAEFNDALTRLTSSVTGIKNQVGAALVPTLTSLADSITGVTKGFIEWIKTNQELFAMLTQLTMGLGGVLVVLGGLILLMPGLTAAAAALGVSVIALLPLLAALALGLGAVTFGIMELIKASTLQKRVTKDIRDMELEYIKMLAGKENQYNEMALAYAEDIKMRQAMGRAAEEEISWLEGNKEALEALRKEQTLQSDVVLPKLQAQMGALAQANVVLGDSYGYVAGMAKGAWEAMSVGRRGGYVGSFMEERGYSPAEIAAEQRFGKWFAKQPFGRLTDLPPQPSLRRPGFYTPGQLNVHVYLDGREVGISVIDRIEEEVRLQGGL